MSSSSKYIVITESHDLDDGPMDSGTKIHEENERASLQALEKQGISILNEMENTMSTQPRDKFLQELMTNGGIEIVESEDEDELSL